MIETLAVVALVVGALKADPDVKALVAKRIYAGLIPQSAAQFPAITYLKVSRVPDKLLDEGPAKDEDWRLQLDCYAVGKDSVDGLGDAVRAALDGKTFADLEVGLTVGLDSDRDTIEDLQESGTLKRINRISMDFLISAAEAA